MPDPNPEGSISPVSESVMSQTVAAPENRNPFKKLIDAARSKLGKGRTNEQSAETASSSLPGIGAVQTSSTETPIAAPGAPTVVETAGSAESQEAVANNLEATLQATASSQERAGTINNPVNSFTPNIGPMGPVQEQGPVSPTSPTTEEKAA